MKADKHVKFPPLSLSTLRDMRIAVQRASIQMTKQLSTALRVDKITPKKEGISLSTWHKKATKINKENVESEEEKHIEKD
jgi:hypothetical protein